MKRDKKVSQISAHLQKEILKLEKLYNLVWVSRKQLNERGFLIPQLYVALLSCLIAEKPKFSSILLETYEHSRYKRLWGRFNSLIDNLTRFGFSVQGKDTSQMESRSNLIVDLEGLQNDTLHIIKKYFDKEEPKLTLNAGEEAIIAFEQRKSLEDNREGVTIPPKVLENYEKGYQSLKKWKCQKSERKEIEPSIERQSQIVRKLGDVTRKTLREESEEKMDLRRKLKKSREEERLPSQDNITMNAECQKTQEQQKSDKTVKRDSLEIIKFTKPEKKKKLAAIRQPKGSSPVPPPDIRSEIESEPVNSVVFLSPGSQEQERQGSLFSHIHKRQAYCEEYKDELHIVVKTSDHERCKSPQI